MHATNGSRTTGFEGTLWVNGELDDDDDGWPKERIEIPWWG